MVTQINFTLDFLKLKEGLVQSDLNDLVKSAMVLILNEYMEKERDDYMKNQPYDRTDDRHDYRNGYYKRNYVLNNGKIKPNVTPNRRWNFPNKILEKYQRWYQALIPSMTKMFVNGGSTRKVSN